MEQPCWRCYCFNTKRKTTKAQDGYEVNRITTWICKNCGASDIPKDARRLIKEIPERNWVGQCTNLGPNMPDRY